MRLCQCRYMALCLCKWNQAPRGTKGGPALSQLQGVLDGINLTWLSALEEEP